MRLKKSETCIEAQGFAESLVQDWTPILFILNLIPPRPPSVPYYLSDFNWIGKLCIRKGNIHGITKLSEIQEFLLILSSIPYHFKYFNIVLKQENKCHLAITYTFSTSSQLGDLLNILFGVKTYLGIMHKWNFEKDMFFSFYFITMKLYLFVLEDDLRV